MNAARYHGRRPMKRYAPYAVCIAGIVAIVLLLPRFNTAQPRGIRLTRGDARAIANRAARDVGIPVDKAWETVTWRTASLLAKELRTQPQRRAAAYADPVISPRLDSYFIHFYRTTKEKGIGYGYVFVNGRNGDVVGARRFYRDEEKGPPLTEAERRRRAPARGPPSAAPRPLRPFAQLPRRAVAAVRVGALHRHPQSHRLGLPLPR